LKVELLPRVTISQLDANDAAAVSQAVRGQDAVISATKFTQTDTRALISGITAAAMTRYLVVGGAGSLESTLGTREVDDPRFPAAVRPEALAGCEFLERLRASDLDWTFLWPDRAL
jgi:putative NADH-flavin reductase